ncbi:MAG: hypothetical protein KI790_03720 [Cyclobacteriaceae bacterium]|nr:hypothetical protein [Cyclobacteriaceae bacterium HetDA_MAG_MS6]
MKRALLLIFVAIATFALFALYKNPEVLEDIWIWILGLIGTIVKGGKSIVEYFKQLLEGKQEDVVYTTANQEGLTPKADVRLTLLRYSDDGDTTVGLLYINDSFYCYTLEDTHQEIKVPGNTRIPAGAYQVTFNKTDTPLTLKYREKNPEWFTYHLQLQEVPGFTTIYIHNGGDHTDTEGCILVSDSLSVSDANTFLTNSRNTFKRIYGVLSSALEQEQKIMIKIHDEAWFENRAS